MNKLQVLLADDHAVVREGLKSLISAQHDMEVVGEAGDGRTAVQLTQRLHPDIVVMDISMPGLGGAVATQKLRHLCPNVKVLALTVHEDRSYARQLLQAGAAGYILKRAAADELVTAIRTVAASGSYLDSSVAAQIDGVGCDTSSTNSAAHVDLSEREESVVRLIAHGYSNKEIAARLGISVKSVETYKMRAMEKLALRSRTDLVRYAVHRGWLNEGSAPASPG